MSHSSSFKGTQDDPSIGLFLRVQYLSCEIQERQLEEAQYATLWQVRIEIHMRAL